MKRMQRVLFSALVFVALLSATFTIPAVTPKVHAASCLGGAVGLPQITLAPGQYYSTTTYQTSTSCNDINFKYTSSLPSSVSISLIDIRVCFLPSSGGISCNDWKWYNDFVWHTPATTVKDYTKYYIEFRNIAMATTVTFNSQVAD